MPIQQLELTGADLVVGMEPCHLNSPALEGFAPAQMTLLGLWGRPRKVYIHDPYGAGSHFFECCERYVVASTKRLVQVWDESRRRQKLA